MQFLYPNMLYGLLAVSIPVIIHLLNLQRYKRVYFTQTNLIADLQKQSRRRSDLRHWLVLLMRMLAIAMLVMAFSNPFIVVDDNDISKAENFVSIYLDNSYSMQADNPEGDLLGEAKAKATALVEGFEPSVRFQLLTNELKGKQQRWLTGEQVLTEIEEIRFSPHFRYLSEIIHRQQQLLSDTEAQEGMSYIISDFQKTSYDLNDVLDDSLFSFSYIPVRSYQTENVYIDSVWFSSPALFVDQTAELNVRIASFGEQSSVALKCFINHSQRLAVNAEFDGQDRKTFTFTLNIKNTGLHYGRLEIADNSLDFDNAYYFSFRVPASADVLVIGNDQDRNKYLEAYFQDDSLVRVDFTSHKTIDYQSLSSYSSIILDGIEEISSGLKSALKEQVERGKSLTVFPSFSGDKASYNAMFDNYQGVKFGEKRSVEQNVQEVAWESGFFDGIFQDRPEHPEYPMVFEDVRLHYDRGSAVEPLITQADGSPFLLRMQAGKGNVYLFSVACHRKSSNFVTHSLFSVLYKMVLEGLQTGQLYYTLGKKEIYTNPHVDFVEDEMPELVSRSTEESIIPQMLRVDEGLRFVSSRQVVKNGIWDLMYAGEKIDALAFNYDGRESDIRLFDITKNKPSGVNILDQSPDKITAGIQMKRQGRQLWQWFIVAALLFLLAEVLLLRMWKL
ncbi:MAG: BatA domain-containing protein [Bacteroidales bacterium]